MTGRVCEDAGNADVNPKPSISPKCGGSRRPRLQGKQLRAAELQRGWETEAEAQSGRSCLLGAGTRKSFPAPRGGRRPELPGGTEHGPWGAGAAAPPPLPGPGASALLLSDAVDHAAAEPAGPAAGPPGALPALIPGLLGARRTAPWVGRAAGGGAASQGGVRGRAAPGSPRRPPGSPLLLRHQRASKSKLQGKSIC